MCACILKRLLIRAKALMNSRCFQPIRVMSEAVLQQCEHDMVHEHNEGGWGMDLCSNETESMYYKHPPTPTHRVLCHGVMVTDCCTRVVH